MTDEPSPPPSPSTGQGQKILKECLRSERAFVKAMEAGDPLIMEALAAFEPAGEAGATTSPRPSSMEQDPQIEQALGTRPGWESDLRMSRERHARHVVSESVPRMPGPR